MKKNRWLAGRILAFLICGVLVNSMVVSAHQENETTITNEMLYARSAVLMDAESGRILFGKNENEVMPMASTTKIMTLIVTLENADLTDVVTVSKYAASMPDVQLNIREGEQYYLKDLVYSMMLESHNDSAVAIAEHVGGSIEGFATMMNKKALDIGCRSSFFITPNGLDATASVTGQDGVKKEVFHGTTAAELARIMSYCVTASPEKTEFLKITEEKSYSFSDLANKRQFTCNNHNALLNMMDGAISGKTGFTAKAGYCYVGAVNRDGRIFVAALLACGWPGNKTYKWSDMRKLIAYGCDTFHFQPFEEQKLLREVPTCIPVENGQSDCIGKEAVCSLKTIQNVSHPICPGVLLRDGENIQIRIDMKKHMQAPAPKNQKIGSASFYVGDEQFASYDILLNEDVEAIDYRWCLGQVLALWDI